MNATYQEDLPLSLLGSLALARWYWSDRSKKPTMLAKNIFYFVIMSVFALVSANQETEDGGSLGEGVLVSFTPSQGLHESCASFCSFNKLTMHFNGGMMTFMQSLYTYFLQCTLLSRKTV